MKSTYKVHYYICIIVSRESNLFSPYRRSVYLFCFVSVLSSILPISQMVPSITYAISFSLSRTTMYGLFAPSSGHVLSNCWMSQKIFALEFSTVANRGEGGGGGGGWRFHGGKFGWFNRSYLSRRLKYMGLSILLCLALHKICEVGVQ